MSPHDDIPSPFAQRARVALSALAAPPPPRPEFRARLKQEFASGTIERSGLARSVAGDTLAAPRPEVLAFPRRGLATPWRWALAAAAVVVVTIGVYATNDGPAWRLVSASGEGVASVDGRPIAMNHTDELRTALVPGARVRVPPGCRIEIASARTLAIQMVAETDATVPPVPGRWFHRGVAGEIQAGEWRITTGPEFRGATLAVTTPSAHIEVTGTTLAVICEPQGTCVCVFEGRVMVGHDRTDMAPVVQGHRRYMFVDDSREPENAEMRPTEAGVLPGFREAMTRQMTGAR